MKARSIKILTDTAVLQRVKFLVGKLHTNELLTSQHDIDAFEFEVTRLMGENNIRFMKVRIENE